MALDDVFGIFKPRAATIGTTMGVVRLFGIPPMECLSTTIQSLGHSICFPISTIAFVRDIISFIDIPTACIAVK